MPSNYNISALVAHVRETLPKSFEFSQHPIEYGTQLQMRDGNGVFGTVNVYRTGRCTLQGSRSPELDAWYRDIVDDSHFLLDLLQNDAIYRTEGGKDWDAAMDQIMDARLNHEQVIQVCETSSSTLVLTNRGNLYWTTSIKDAAWHKVQTPAQGWSSVRP